MELSLRKWMSSTTKNKIGTVLFGIATVSIIIYTILLAVNIGNVNAYMAQLCDEEGLVPVPVDGTILSGILNIIEYCLLFFFILMGSNIATSIGQVFGIVSLVAAVAVGLLMLVFVIFLYSYGMGEMLEALVFVFDKTINEFPMLKASFALSSISSLCIIIGAFFLTVLPGTKSRLAALLFLIFTGIFGGHDFYVGRKGRGIVKVVLLILVITIPVLLIILLVDLIMICCGKYKDSEKNLVTEWIVE